VMQNDAAIAAHPRPASLRLELRMIGSGRPRADLGSPIQCKQAQWVPPERADAMAPRRRNLVDLRRNHCGHCALRMRPAAHFPLPVLGRLPWA
jgi:hypothetical protein